MKGFCLFVFYVNEWGVLLYEARFAFERKFRGNSIEFDNCFENSRNISTTMVNTQFLSPGRIGWNNEKLEAQLRQFHKGGDL